MQKPKELKQVGTRITRTQKVLLPLIAVLVVVGLLEGVSHLLLWALGPLKTSGVRFMASDVLKHEEHPYHKRDQELFWKPNPNYSEINRRGFRGPEFELPKPEGTFRIVLLGNSVTFGFGVSVQDSYSCKLNQYLGNEASHIKGGRYEKVEVINAGVIGFTSFQGRILYERIARTWEPDLLVVCFGYNDHHSAVQSDAEKYVRRNLHARLTLVRRTAIFNIAHRLSGHTEPQLRTEPVPRVSLEAFRENILAIREMAASDNADCIFMTVWVRPGIPMVENFCAVDIKDQRVWIRQIDFAVSCLDKRMLKIIEGHFLKGGDIRAFCESQVSCATTYRLSELFPSLPIFHYLLAQCYAVEGREGAAQERMRKCVLLDQERREMAAYNDILRNLAHESYIEMIDMARKMEGRSAEDLLMDVVHPTPDGHDLMARILTGYILDKYGMKADPGR